jgi:carboxyl-terminal processing protease
MLNKGDKIQSLQWEGQKPIDVSDASKEEVSQILSASNRDKMILTIKKADGTLREVTLQKEKATDDGDDGRVRSFILKGGKTIGYISIPAFYTDWSENEHDENGCANDVAKEIVKLKKEKIDGLIVDVRFNGGGSMEEAIQLSGIFIDAGPVGQYKTHEGKVYTLKDANRGTIYDGPLMIMINGYSASASEMIAGTLQDYNRALIVGTPSYGKATAQVVLPMDTTLDGTKKLSQHGSASFIKVTNASLYRVNGTTAQGKGVIPDVILPDFSEADDQKEANELNTLRVAAIDANKYYKPLQPLPATALKSLAESKMSASEYFKAVHQYKKLYSNINKSADVSLLWSDAIKEKKKQSEAFDVEKIQAETNTVFTINNNFFETQRLVADESRRQANDQIKTVLKNDAQLKVAYELMMQLTK